MLNDTRRRSLEVGRFLRSRRTQVQPTPDEVRARPRRRVSGLTREEIAARAGVSLTWYSWLEMGRDVRATPDTLASIARALELNADETSYLLTLAGDVHSYASSRSQSHDYFLQTLVDEVAGAPAFVVDRKWSIVAANRHARDVYGFTPSRDLRQNILFRLLNDPDLRALHDRPDEMMRSVAALIRYNFADDPENDELTQLVTALEHDFRFREAWDSYSVRTFSPFDVCVRWNGTALHFRFVALGAGHLGHETLVVHLPLDQLTRSSLTSASGVAIDGPNL